MGELRLEVASKFPYSADKKTSIAQHYILSLIMIDSSPVTPFGFGNTYDSWCIYPRSHDFQPNFIIILYDNVFIFGLVTWGVGIGAELHIRRDGL